MGKVVVGVDGSPEAKRALDFALEEARLRHAILDVVYVRHPVPAPDLPALRSLDSGVSAIQHAEDLTDRGRELVEQRATRDREAAEKLLADAVEALDLDGVTVERTLLVDGRPARRLVQHAEDAEAELLVVGSRGRGELTGMLIGSVSQACVTHARVPVTVVPER